MAAEVSALVCVLNGYNREDLHRLVGKDSSDEESTALITCDLLGGSSSSSTTTSSSMLPESQELDLDLQVPNGWEKHLDLKVKLALKRAEESTKKRASLCKSSLSPSYSSSSSSVRETQEEDHDNQLLSSPTVTGCPGCLCYVLITKNNPNCPRCRSVVPLPVIKKPRIDLNISI
ncbi:hypothetical protein F2P56_019599 [Juglans regia]|uniref:GIR1-like zinc ribbon domain-containing protein n=1 Tax=Juglans regia TaxID=51240 RepID=A0A833UNP7_JUGRE|nr:hypothetical protein F2P56_019599 [Juglans regia]